MLTLTSKEAEKQSFDEYAAIAAALQPYIERVPGDREYILV